MSSLSKFTVIDLIKTRSSSVVSITGNYLKFNAATAAELNYPAYIQILINPKDKQFAIRACKKNDPNAIPFAKSNQKAVIKFALAAAAYMIRKMAGRSSEESWNIPGIYFADDEALVYDVSTATKPGPPRGGRPKKRDKDTGVEEADN